MSHDAEQARVEYDDVESAHTKQRQQAQQRLKAAAAAAVAKASPKRTPSASSGGAVSSPSSRNLDLSASNAAAVVSSDLDDSPATGTCKDLRINLSSHLSMRFFNRPLQVDRLHGCVWQDRLPCGACRLKARAVPFQARRVLVVFVIPRLCFRGHGSLMISLTQLSSQSLYTLHNRSCHETTSEAAFPRSQGLGLGAIVAWLGGKVLTVLGICRMPGTGSPRWTRSMTC